MQLYSRNELFIKNIPLDQAAVLVTRGDAMSYCRHCLRSSAVGRCIGSGAHDFIVQLREFQDIDRAGTPASLTPSEMRINAGLMGSRKREIINRKTKEVVRPANFVDEVMSKIEVWAEIGDTKAVRVCPAG